MGVRIFYLLLNPKRKNPHIRSLNLGLWGSLVNIYFRKNVRTQSIQAILIQTTQLYQLVFFESGNEYDLIHFRYYCFLYGYKKHMAIIKNINRINTITIRIGE